MLKSWHFLFIFFFQYLYGADENESWSSIGLEKKLPYSLKLEFEQGLRLKDQLSTFKQTFSEVALSYKIFKGIRVFVPIRYAIFQDKKKQRLCFGSSFKYTISPISFKYRTKFQKMYENSEFSEDLFRNKISIDYKLNKKIEPFISGEFFHLYVLGQYQIDEYRLSFGIEVDLPRKKAIKIFYTYKLEDIKKSSPDQINVFGVAYNYKWRKKE